MQLSNAKAKNSFERKATQLQFKRRRRKKKKEEKMGEKGGEHMKPVLLKAGIPLALTLAGFLFSIIVRRKGRFSARQRQLNAVDDVINEKDFNDGDKSDSLDSTLISHNEQVEEDQCLQHAQGSDSVETLQCQCPDEVGEAVIKQVNNRPELEEEIEGLQSQVCDLQDREGELEARFLHYCSLQEYGSALNELQNALELEMAHVEFLDMKVGAMGAETQKFRAIIAEYPRVLEELASENSKVELLQKRMKKLSKLNGEVRLVLRRQVSVLKAREAEISSKNEELQRREQELKELENAIVELRGVVDQLEEEEEKGMMEKLKLGERVASSTSKNDGEEMMTDDGHNQLLLDYQEMLTQLEQLQKERSAEADELKNLRWINGCLRHELTKYKEERTEEKEEEKEKEKQPEMEFAGNDEKGHCNMGYNVDGSLMGTEPMLPCTNITAARHAGSSRRVLLHKLKRWVKGKEKQKSSFDEESQDKCSGACTASDEAVEEIATRKSCSRVKPCIGRASVT